MTKMERVTLRSGPRMLAHDGMTLEIEEPEFLISPALAHELRLMEKHDQRLRRRRSPPFGRRRRVRYGGPRPRGFRYRVITVRSRDDARRLRAQWSEEVQRSKSIPILGGHT